MTYNLFIDDIRNPDWDECIKSGVNLLDGGDWVIARSTEAAKAIVEARGMPTRLALDHDLGELPDGTVDQVPTFLKWLAYEYWNGTDPIPSYTIHSSNSAGIPNMVAFMESWKKSLTL